MCKGSVTILIKKFCDTFIKLVREIISIIYAAIKMKLFIIIIIVTLGLVNAADKHKNKYSKDANVPTIEKYNPEIRDIEQPFRMSKLNSVWSKARHRLTEPKLKSLYTELKIQDKEELAWKELGAKLKDKDGIKEAELRKKLIRIMTNYGLAEHFEEGQNTELFKDAMNYDGKSTHINKSLYKDKKLNRLWEKAEMAGFTTDEMKALREEFQHHQEKIDVYYNLLDNLSQDESANEHENHKNVVDAEDRDRFNEITYSENHADSPSKHTTFTHNTNQLRSKHQDIRDNFDRLERIAAKGPNSKDFIEPKVQGLWRVALAGGFSTDELASIKTELLHFEKRLMKLREMHAEHAIASEKYKNTHGDKKHDKLSFHEENLKKHSRKVEKFQEEIERRIFKHSEL